MKFRSKEKGGSIKARVAQILRKEAMRADNFFCYCSPYQIPTFPKYPFVSSLPISFSHSLQK